MTQVILLSDVTSMDDLAEIAIRDLEDFAKNGGEIIQICGPMSTGGLGNLEKNMNRFRKAIRVARNRGLSIFDQLPYQEAIVRISGYHLGSPYNMDILEVLYRRLFESGHIQRTLFLPDWESSKGASWEHKLITKLEIPFEIYPIEWLNEEE